MASDIAAELFGLLGHFPVEIRVMIYGSAVLEDGDVIPYQVGPGSNKFRRVIFENDKPKNLPTPTIASLITTCRGIKAEIEAFQPFYRVNSFSFQSHEDVATYMAAISSRGRSAICNIVLRLSQSDVHRSSSTSPAGWTFLQMECQSLQHLSIIYKRNWEYHPNKLETALWMLRRFLQRHPLPSGLRTVDLHCTGSMVISGIHQNVEVSHLFDSKPLELRVVGTTVAPEALTAATATLHHFKPDFLSIGAQCMLPKQARSHSSKDEERLLKLLLASKVEQWGKGNPRPVSHRTRLKTRGRFDENGHLIRDKSIYGDDGYLLERISNVLNARVGDAVSIAEFQVEIQGGNPGTHWVSFESLMGPYRWWSNSRQIVCFYYQVFCGQITGVQIDTVPHPHDLAEFLSRMKVTKAGTYRSLGKLWQDRSPRASF